MVKEWTEIYNLKDEYLPKFYEDDKIMFVKNNSIYGYDLNTKRNFYSLQLEEIIEENKFSLINGKNPEKCF